MQAGMTLKAFQVSLRKKKKNETNILIYRFNATQIKIATPSFSDTEKNSPQIHMGLQKSPHRYSNPEKYKLLLEDHHTWFQAMLQSKSIKKLMELA